MLTLKNYDCVMSKTYGDWILKKMQEWEDKRGERSTITAFAKYVGMSQSTLSSWMSETRKPSAEAALKLAIKFHDYEILDLLGYPRPQLFDVSDEQLLPIAEAILQFPEHVRPQIRKAIVKTLEDLMKADQPPSEEETLKLMAERILSELEKE
jgi:transcriptional regulator with XRE-family HTH domain